MQITVFNHLHIFSNITIITVRNVAFIHHFPIIGKLAGSDIVSYEY